MKWLMEHIYQHPKRMNATIYTAIIFFGLLFGWFGVNLMLTQRHIDSEIMQIEIEQAIDSILKVDTIKK